MSRIPGHEVSLGVFVVSCGVCHFSGSARGVSFYGCSHTWLRSPPHLLLINPLQYLRSSHTSSQRRIVVKYRVCYHYFQTVFVIATVCLSVSACRSWSLAIFLCLQLTVSLCLRNHSRKSALEPSPLSPLRLWASHSLDLLHLKDPTLACQLLRSSPF